MLGVVADKQLIGRAARGTRQTDERHRFEQITFACGVLPMDDRHPATQRDAGVDQIPKSGERKGSEVHDGKMD